MVKTVITTVVVVLLMFIGVWLLIGTPSLDSIKNAINVINVTSPRKSDNSSKHCSTYSHYENGQKVYDYVKCIPVTPEAQP